MVMHTFVWSSSWLDDPDTVCWPAAEGDRNLIWKLSTFSKKSWRRIFETLDTSESVFFQEDDDNDTEDEKDLEGRGWHS